MQLSALEYREWEKHLVKYPVGDFYVQVLLVQIITLLYQIGGAKTAVAVDKIAPWLFYENESEREEKDLAMRRNMTLFFAQTGVEFESG